MHRLLYKNIHIFSLHFSSASFTGAVRILLPALMIINLAFTIERTALLASHKKTVFPSLTLYDLNGKPVQVFNKNRARAIVFIFTGIECPISNRYAPEIRRLHRKFNAQGIKFWLVHPNRDETLDAIKKNAKDYNYPFGVLRDPRHTLVRQAKVKVTPEAAVFLPNGRLVYHGRIDNRYVTFGKVRPAPTQFDLQNVLESIRDRKAIVTASAPAVGCAISELP